MRILAASDSHGDFNNLYRAVSQQPTCEIVFFLGDGEYDCERIKSQFSDKMFVIVSGNCDSMSLNPLKKTVCAENTRIFATHGHLYNVKYDLNRLYLAGKEENADIVLFGHTHTPHCEYVDGIYLFNPGSIRGYNGTYGVIDITDSGIVPNIIAINKVH